MKSLIIFFLLFSSAYCETIIINAVGDTMTGTYFPEKRVVPKEGEEAFKFSHFYLTNNKPDILIANLEGVITPLKTPVKKIIPGKSFAFNMPTNTAKYLKEVGFNVVSTANNHARDFGDVGLKHTEEYLKKEGVFFTGRKGQYVTIEKKGIKIAIAGFSWHSWANCYLNTKEASDFIKNLKATHDIVIISVHGGAEGEKAMYIPDADEYLFSEHRGNLYRFCRLAIDNGADLIIGHGPHVVRGMEIYKDRLIAYSLGNFLTPAMSTAGNKKYTLILKVELDKTGKFVSGEIVPMKQHYGNIYYGMPYYDEEKTTIKLIQKLSKENFKNNNLIISDDGILSYTGEKK
ncbi:MAG: CapA family protein [Brevinematales bacterium]|nr:CapA family protein [Brevinematales bacterium]